MTVTFEHSRKALAEWLAIQDQRYTELRAVKTNEEFAAWEKIEETDKQKVCEAFYQDTKAYNSRANCALVHPRDVERIIKITDQKVSK